MLRVLKSLGLVCASVSPSPWPALSAQVQTGSITGTVSDASGAVLPGVNVTLTGDRLIGGTQTIVTDATGDYRFDRLSPGTYDVKFELQGFKTVERADVVVNAGFVATINAKLEVGALTETITVTGESPTVDVRSNVQQTVMNQEILEGVPTGRDPWSLAKIIPGVQVSTYDVGGTQSIQQSSAVVARLQHQRRQLQHRRRHGELARRRRRRDDALLRPGDVRGGQLHDLGDSRRSAGRRRLDQHGDQDRQQPVARRPALQLRQRRPAVGELVRHAGAQPDVPRQPDQEDLRPQPLGRRPDRAEPALGQRHLPQVGRQQAGQRPEPRRQPGARRQRPEELLGQGRRPDQPEPQADRCRTCGTTRSAATAATRRRTSWKTSPRWCRPTRRRPPRSSTPASSAAWSSSRTSA